MSDPVPPIKKLATIPNAEAFRRYAADVGAELPCDDTVERGGPLATALAVGSFALTNRFVVQPMEGWDGELSGKPTERTARRWARFGSSGAGLVWGGEAVAVCHKGRANPNQLTLTESNVTGIAGLRNCLLEASASTNAGSPPIVGLQLTHSGRWSRPDGRPAPVIAAYHPILDRRQGLPVDHPLISDSELREVVEQFGVAAKRAASIGFEFVDLKQCHAYLGHELLAARTRPGEYGASFENRTRFLRECVESIRSQAPGLDIAVRLSAFDLIPFRPDPDESAPGRPGRGIPEPHAHLAPYRWGFGVNENDPTRFDLTETFRLFELFQVLGIRLVNVTAGSPYYNPHIQRPAYYPPSDGYLPPEDPLIGVARQLGVCRELKRRFPEVTIVGSAFSVLQEFLPNVAQAAVREGWIDLVGLGRMTLSYPDFAADVLAGRPSARKRICRTFSDCTTAPRNGLVSGCYPLDPYYKGSPEHIELQKLRRARTGEKETT